MAKKAIVSLTGGLNNIDRPDTLEEDQLQECVNYEITGVGRLEKRTEPSHYSTTLKNRLYYDFEELPQRRGYGIIVLEDRVRPAIEKINWSETSFISTNGALNLRVDLIEKGIGKNLFEEMS